MSTVAYLREEHAPGAAVNPALNSAGGVTLGPGTVTAVSGSSVVTVRLADGTLREARLAMPMRYEAREGDVLLVIGNPEGHFVIGVLHGEGTTSFEVPGDVRVRAVGGTLRLQGDRAVELQSPEVSLVATKMSVLANSVIQKFTTVRQRVTEMLETYAGASKTTVDGTAHTAVRRATMLAEESVVINGKAIHLG